MTEDWRVETDKKVSAFEQELMELCKKHQIKIVSNEVWGIGFCEADDPNTSYYDDNRKPLKAEVWEIGPEGIK